MSDMSNDRKGTTTYDSLLEILDNVIGQLNFTRKMMIIMILSFITIVPIIAILGYMSQSMAGIGKFIPIIGSAVFLVWLAVGIRQWMVFSKWMRKYREFKILQKKVEESLDFEKNNKSNNSSI